MRIVDEITIGHPVDRVWPYLAEPERWPDFIPALVERTRIGDDPVDVGAIWKSVDRIGPWKVSFTDRLGEIEPKTRVVWEHSEPWNAHTEYRLEQPDDDSSLLRLHFEGRPTGWMRLLDWIPDAMLKRTLRSDFNRLERLLDGEGQGP